MPRYFKERDRTVIRYVEIADDLYASRQVDDYGKGRVLRYDRHRAQDEFGFLMRCLFSHKAKAITRRSKAEPIEAAEFEKAWIKNQD
jgi:hypothetical protein